MADDFIGQLPAWLDLDNLRHGGADHRFDEFLNFAPEKQAELVAWLSPLIDGKRTRARKAEAQANFKQTLGCVIANAIVATEDQWATQVHYSRDERAYAGISPYKPDWLHSKQLIQTIDGLEAAGLIRSTKATPAPAHFKSHRSTYRPDASFLAELKARGFTPDQAQRDTASAPVVFLRSDEGRSLNYALADRACEIADLRAYNAFLKGQAITLATGPSHSSAPIIDFEKVGLRRIYNQSFDRGGRFYGAWWQAQPQEVRARILINGEPTVELDYSAFLPRALYHEEGIDYRGDPYAAPELIKAFRWVGVPWEQGRRIVKTVFFAMLNAKSRSGLHANADVRKLPGSISAKDAFDALERHNAPIKHRFFTGYSMQLMKKESQICAEIMKRGMESHIPILPIHDSYVVPISSANWIRETMIHCYVRAFGFDPIVS